MTREGPGEFPAPTALVPQQSRIGVPARPSPTSAIDLSSQ